MKEDKNAKSLAKNLSGLCNSSYARYSEKRFTQIYIALYQDAFRGTNMAAGNLETSVFKFSYLCVNCSLEELIKIKIIFILRQGMFI